VVLPFFVLRSRSTELQYAQHNKYSCHTSFTFIALAAINLIALNKHQVVDTYGKKRLPTLGLSPQKTSGDELKHASAYVTAAWISCLDYGGGVPGTALQNVYVTKGN
jgi:hypothetical protein